jgi:ApbE superfamily uncharacterized protein (UPF0280 family)
MTIEIVHVLCRSDHLFASVVNANASIYIYNHICYRWQTMLAVGVTIDCETNSCTLGCHCERVQGVCQDSTYRGSSISFGGRGKFCSHH